MTRPEAAWKDLFTMGYDRSLKRVVVRAARSIDFVSSLSSFVFHASLRKTPTCVRDNPRMVVLHVHEMMPQLS
jgi:hypothetical protein